MTRAEASALHPSLALVFALAAVPACAGVSPLPALDLSVLTTLATARTVDATRARAVTRVGAALRWRGRGHGEPDVDARYRGVPGRDDAGCSVEAACAWEVAARAEALGALEEGIAP